MKITALVCMHFRMFLTMPCPLNTNQVPSSLSFSSPFPEKTLLYTFVMSPAKGLNKTQLLTQLYFQPVVGPQEQEKLCKGFVDYV